MLGGVGLRETQRETELAFAQLPLSQKAEYSQACVVAERLENPAKVHTDHLKKLSGTVYDSRLKNSPV